MAPKKAPASGPASQVVVSYGPASVADLEPLQLPDPRTDRPRTYYLAGGSTLLEATRYKQQHSSWFVGQRVVSDGGLLMLTPVDPLLLLLPRLADARKRSAEHSGLFCQVDQLLPHEDQPGVLRLLRAAEPALRCICDVKEVDDDRYYRLNDNRALAWLVCKAHTAQAACARLLFASSSSSSSGGASAGGTAAASGGSSSSSNGDASSSSRVNGSSGSAANDTVADHCNGSHANRAAASNNASAAAAAEAGAAAADVPAASSWAAAADSSAPGPGTSGTSTSHGGSAEGALAAQSMAYAVGMLGEYLAEAWLRQLEQLVGVDRSPASQPGAEFAGLPEADADAMQVDKKPRLDPKEAAKLKAAQTRAEAKAAQMAKVAAGTKKISSFFTRKAAA